MSFDSRWLDLREPADLKARDRALMIQAKAFCADCEDAVIVDLGAGTGSTARAFSDVAARWRLVDNDRRLLDEAQRRHVDVEAVELDLTRTEWIPLDGATMVTASALFDLASAAWIEALADRLARGRVALYAALNYDGQLRWQPGLPGDEAVRDAFNRHQRTDKGFGTALGPEGGEAVADAMRRRGYHVVTADSAWRLEASERELAERTLEGIAHAAAEMGAPDGGEWLAARRRRLGEDMFVVGHVDVLALPA